MSKERERQKRRHFEMIIKRYNDIRLIFISKEKLEFGVVEKIGSLSWFGGMIKDGNCDEKTSIGCLFLKRIKRILCAAR